MTQPGMPQPGKDRPHKIDYDAADASLASDNIAWAITYAADVIASSLDNAVRAYRDVSMRSRRG